MDRRRFLRNATIAAAGVVAADQLELVERLGWTRRLFPGWGRPTLYGDGIRDDTEALQALFDGREVYDRRTSRVIGGRAPFSVVGGNYRVTQTVRAHYPGQTGDGLITTATFHRDGLPRDTPMFILAPAPKRFPFG